MRETMNQSILNRSVGFFDTQFQRQSERGEYVLNPFEAAILPYLAGDVLDLGCGLGNLAVAAAQRGCPVTAIDASPAAIQDLKKRAAAAALSIDARLADLRGFVADRSFDCVVSIGLLMFFRRDAARLGLQRIRAAVAPGGLAAVNVLIEGTTFMGMFDGADYTLFGENELQDAFGDWKTDYLKLEPFVAPGDTVKRFCTIVARRPQA